ncbi:MAG: DUF3575 domain-containing protein [Bacteroidota bacterium]|nr:DUF3575 domain-containing protein [Bacteroidota bacterium]MDP4232623.1 DUF3575 domain-containing protein [Bacteroidota bacterium]MDP4243875.1 DUF3575 domain-containing protein [Bacteroidota bacterium]MDP4289283.1 DUF3575 domain-containing protein [Bacteroidota bacterium]
MIRKATVATVLIAVFGLCVGLSTNANAQEKDDWMKPITKQGSAAFVFTINGLGSFGIGGPGLGAVPVPIQGDFNPRSPADSMMTLNGLGMKYFFSDDMALRVALGFNHSSRKDFDTSSFAPAMTAWGIGVGVEDHFRPLYSVSPYAGLQVKYASESADEQSNQNITYSGHTFGIGAFAGFDWFVTHGIAIGAEGGLGWMTSSFSQTLSGTGGSTTTGPDVSSIALAMDGLVHVVVYF